MNVFINLTIPKVPEPVPTLSKNFKGIIYYINLAHSKNVPLRSRIPGAPFYDVLYRSGFLLHERTELSSQGNHMLARSSKEGRVAYLLGVTKMR